METFFATAPKGLEELLAEELSGLGARDVKITVAGVHFSADWETAYAALLWSRLASRILYPLAAFEATSPDALYDQLKGIDWSEHMDVSNTLVVSASVTRSVLTHDRYVAQRTKDAVVDQFREKTGDRPSVDRENPDLRINVAVRAERVNVSIDLCGRALSARGYRREHGEAPMRENLAAAVLLRAGWPAVAAEGGSLVDPMCGAGTLLIEGLMMAADLAPGLNRDVFGVMGWKKFDRELWDRVLASARERSDAGLAHFKEQKIAIAGFDRDQTVLDRARNNAELAGVVDLIQLGRRDLALWKVANARGWRPGLVVVNPPYGERLGDHAELPALYATLGSVLSNTFNGWQAAVFTGNPAMGKRMGIRAQKRYKLFNGSIPCELLRFTITEEWLIKHGGKAQTKGALSEGAATFANRLRKNIKALRKWVKAEGITAYRVYDADIPEYNVAVDLYGEVVIVSEYAAPSEVDPGKAERRLEDVLLVIPQVMDVPPDRIALKQRRRRKDGDRYEPLEHRGELVPVTEGGLTFLINPFDYLDVGLFNDHRPIRARIREEARNKRFLNLFGYTGSASVAAAVGGARHTTTVDMSNTYLEWAGKNFEANGFGPGGNHVLERDDCIAWMSHARGQYDLIFLDPPTFSNSKRFDEPFELQSHQVKLIKLATDLLAPDGVLLFSNNFRRFKLEAEALDQAGLDVKEISEQTIPPDFSRNKRIHHCFEIRHKPGHGPKRARADKPVSSGNPWQALGPKKRK